MTVDTFVRRWIKARWGKAWRRKLAKQSKTGTTDRLKWNDFSPETQILIIDATMKTKYLEKGCTDGLHFVRTSMLREVQAFLSLPQTRSAYLCFDTTPSLINKQRVQVQRASKTPMEFPRRLRRQKMSEDDDDDDDGEEDAKKRLIDDEKPIIDDSTIPSKDDWSSFIANKRLYQELVYYYTKRIVEPHPADSPNDMQRRTFKVPLGKSLYLWGGSLVPPAPRSQRIDFPMTKIHAETYENAVFFVSNELDADGEYTSRKWGRCAPECFNLNALQRIKEAEIAVLHFMTYVEKENVTVLSGDGDLIFLLLLASRDRIDPTTGNFKNQVKLRLISRGGDDDKGGGGDSSSEGNVEEIDINVLYQEIVNDPLFLQSGVNDPILLLTLVSALITNDYIYDFGYGLGKCKSPRSMVDGETIPTVLATFLENPAEYKHMARLIAFEKDRGWFWQVFPVYVDEHIFIRFAKNCYLTKYRHNAATALKKVESNVTVSDVREYLYKHRGKTTASSKKSSATAASPSDRSRKNRMLVDREIRVFSRQILWVLNYWVNGYRKDGDFPGCSLKRYRGYSYFGYAQTSDGTCVKADLVSALMPGDEYEWFIGKPRALLAPNNSLAPRLRDKKVFRFVKNKIDTEKKKHGVITKKNLLHTLETMNEETDSEGTPTYAFLYNPIASQKSNNGGGGGRSERFTMFEPKRVVREKLKPLKPSTINETNKQLY